MQKIVFYLSDLYKGGAQRVIVNLSNYLSNSYDVTVVTTVYCAPMYELDSKIKHISLDEPREGLDGNKIKRNLRRNKRLIDILQTIQPHVVITFLSREIFRILSVKRYITSPVVISFRNDPWVDYNRKSKELLIKTLIRNADGIVFQTDRAKRFFGRRVEEKAIVIPNPINEEFLLKTFPKQRNKEIVSVGKLYKQKNHALLIKAFKRISNKHPDYKLMIYGEGDLRGELEELIRSLGLTEKVLLPGVRSDIQNYIYKSTMFVLSSDYEGMPNALMEAMALGLPVISTDSPSGGTKSLINDGENGLLVSVGDDEKLAEYMNLIISNKELAEKLGKNANKISKNFKPKIVFKQWEEYIKKI